MASKEALEAIDILYHYIYELIDTQQYDKIDAEIRHIIENKFSLLLTVSMLTITHTSAYMLKEINNLFEYAKELGKETGLSDKQIETLLSGFNEK